MGGTGDASFGGRRQDPARVNLLGTVMLGGLHLLGKLAHHVLVDHRIEIAAQHVDEPPVPNVQLAGQRATYLHWNHTVAGIQQTGPEFWHEDDAGAA